MVGGDDAALGDAERCDAFPDANDEGYTGQEAQRFAREPGGPEPGWDHREGAHDAARNELDVARFTPLNIARRAPEIKSHGDAELQPDAVD